MFANEESKSVEHSYFNKSMQAVVMCWQHEQFLWMRVSDSLEIPIELRYICFDFFLRVSDWTFGVFRRFFQPGEISTTSLSVCVQIICVWVACLNNQLGSTQVLKPKKEQWVVRAVELTQAQQTIMNMINPSVVRYPPRSLTVRPLKSYQNPIGKDRLPTTFFHGASC